MILSCVHWEAKAGDQAQCWGRKIHRVMSLRWRLAAERLDGGCKRPRAALSRLHECVHVADAGRYAERAAGRHPGGSGALLSDAGHPDRRAARPAYRLWRLRCCMVSQYCCCLYFQTARVTYKTNCSVFIRRWLLYTKDLRAILVKIKILMCCTNLNLFYFESYTNTFFIWLHTAIV